jgi:signal transduction histidine kinase
VDQNLSADVAVVARISAIPSILEVVCQATGMGYAAVARVTKEHWVACATLDRVNFGLPAGGQLPIETTLCNEVRASNQEIVIDDVPNDPDYATHHTPRIYGLRSYISVPITLSDGSFFGTLCAIDTMPAKLRGTAIVGSFRLFAQLIAHHIDDQRLMDRNQAQLAESLAVAELREQFIAILGHDLRNPLASVQAATRLLNTQPQTDKAKTVLQHLELTTDRMKKLVEDMLDLARGRLSGSLTIDPNETRSIEATLEQIVEETRSAHPQRLVELTCTIDRHVPVDHDRIAQLFSNLIGNAITYGAELRPIRISASTTDGLFEFSVANAGEPIPPEVLARLFQPFYRGTTERKSEGLGLGLYISSQIATAHGGELQAFSDQIETRFTFKIPLTTASPAVAQ